MLPGAPSPQASRPPAPGSDEDTQFPRRAHTGLEWGPGSPGAGDVRRALASASLGSQEGTPRAGLEVRQGEALSVPRASGCSLGRWERASLKGDPTRDIGDKKESPRVGLPGCRVGHQRSCESESQGSSLRAPTWPPGTSGDRDPGQAQTPKDREPPAGLRSLPPWVLLTPVPSCPRREAPPLTQLHPPGWPACLLLSLMPLGPSAPWLCAHWWAHTGPGGPAALPLLTGGPQPAAPSLLTELTPQGWGAVLACCRGPGPLPGCSCPHRSHLG